MGPRTHGPCHNRVSDVAVSVVGMLELCVCVLGVAMVNYYEGIHTLPCVLNILKY